jgi:hypothetical protein
MHLQAWAFVCANRGSLVLVVVVVVIVVVMITIVVGALPPCFFQLFSALVRLFAVFAVTLDRVTQLILGLVDASFALFAPVVVCPYGQRCANQPGNRQQGNAERFDGSSHRISLIVSD